MLWRDLASGVGIGVAGLVIGKSVEFRGFGEADGEVGEVGGEEIDDADGGAGFDVLEGEGVGCAGGGGVLVGGEGEDGGEGTGGDCEVGAADYGVDESVIDERVVFYLVGKFQLRRDRACFHVGAFDLLFLFRPSFGVFGKAKGNGSS